MALRLTGMLAMACAMLGFFVSLLAPHRYVGSTTLRFVRGNVSQSTYEAHARRIADSISSRVTSDESINAMIHRESILTEMVPLYAGSELKDLLRSSVNIRRVTLPDHAVGLSVAYQDDDPERALDIDGVFSRTVARLAASQSPDAQETTEMVEAPNTSLTGATPALLTGIGFASGALLGFVLWIFAPRT
jgi:hypothetical protein